MAAVSQIRYRGTEGRVYCERKNGEGMTGRCALRALKRNISDALYVRMISDARLRTSGGSQGPGGQSGNDSDSSATGSHPGTPALRTSHSRTNTNSRIATAQGVPTSRPAPARRPTSRSAAGGPDIPCAQVVKPQSAAEQQGRNVGGKAWLTGNSGSGRMGVGRGRHASAPG
jgi:hypothetical protein